jgi:hypothetical protein
MNVFVDKIKEILLKPNDFFEKLKNETGVKESFRHFALLSLFSTILSIVVIFLFNKEAVRSFHLESSGPYLVIGYLIGLGFSFLISGALFLWLKLFKAKGKYEKAYQLYVYSRTPKFVYGWIPALDLVAWIHGLILLIAAVQKVYKIKRNKAIIIFVIPAIVFIIITFVAAYYFAQLQLKGGLS